MTFRIFGVIYLLAIVLIPNFLYKSSISPHIALAIFFSDRLTLCHGMFPLAVPLIVHFVVSTKSLYLAKMFLFDSGVCGMKFEAPKFFTTSLSVFRNPRLALMMIKNLTGHTSAKVKRELMKI